MRAAIYLAAILSTSLPAAAAEVTGRVTYVTDGDTFEIDATRIRLCGIDAPERGEANYKPAKDALAVIVEGRDVRCIQVGGGTVCDGRSRPTNGNRIVAQCFVDDQDLAEAMTRAGHACDWVRFSGRYYVAHGATPCPNR